MPGPAVQARRPSLYRPFGDPHAVRDLADPVAAGQPLSYLQPQQLTPPLPSRRRTRPAAHTACTGHTPAARRRHDLRPYELILVSLSEGPVVILSGGPRNRSFPQNVSYLRCDLVHDLRGSVEAVV